MGLNRKGSAQWTFPLLYCGRAIMDLTLSDLFWRNIFHIQEFPFHYDVIVTSLKTIWDIKLKFLLNLRYNLQLAMVAT